MHARIGLDTKIIKRKPEPSPTTSSFVWSIDTVLARLGIEVPVYDIRGFSLNAFAIWAHPDKPVELWSNANSDLFADSMLRSLGLRGELLSAPEKETDLWNYFLRHWSARVIENLKRGIPVVCSEAWSESSWGVITGWDSEKRTLMGYMPGRLTERVNECWPTKIFLIGGSAIPLPYETKIRIVLKQAFELASNHIKKSGWLSGIDAYVLWLENIKEYAKKAVHHNRMAQCLAEARADAAKFLTHHAEFDSFEVGRMMITLAKRYSQASDNLKEAQNSQSSRPFLKAVTEAMKTEEKSLVLLEELLFRLE